MASLEDVKRYAREHADWSRGHLAKDIAKRYDMSREQAESVLASLETEDAAAGRIAGGTDEILPAAGLLAAGAGLGAGTGMSGRTGAGAPALGIIALEEMRDERDRDDASARDDRDDDRRDR